MRPFLERDGVTIYHGDCRDILRSLPPAFVHTVVTSPPYWGLRDYGVDGQLGLETSPDCLGWATGNRCGECYVCRLTAVFQEVHRVLRNDGTLWLNLGDTWNGYVANQRATSISARNQQARPFFEKGYGLRYPGLKNKDLIGIPWRVAFALQGAGWYLRASLIWAKPNPMPESVTDRPTKSHESLFLFSKCARYFYDAEAIREPRTSDKSRRTGRRDNGQHRGSHGRNKRSVWTVPTRSQAGAHFAVFPPDLIRPCLLAGTSAAGCCPACGAPSRRTSRRQRRRQTSQGSGGRHVTSARTPGWEAGCDCGAGKPVPCTVLDPFLGSGTTAEVAQRLGCRCVGIELSDEYCRMAAARFRQRSLLPGMSV